MINHVIVAVHKQYFENQLIVDLQQLPVFNRMKYDVNDNFTETKSTKLFSGSVIIILLFVCLCYQTKLILVNFNQRNNNLYFYVL